MALLAAQWMGASSETAVAAQPSDADCHYHLSLVKGACSIGQNCVTAKTAAKKKTAMADAEQYLGRLGKTPAQSTPLDFHAYLLHYATTHGTFRANGQRFAAPSSVRAQASFIATAMDKNPATVGLWTPLGTNGNGQGNYLCNRLWPALWFSASLHPYGLYV
jgi:hypothetical protein